MDVARTIWKLKTQGREKTMGAEMIAPPVPILGASRIKD
jgi:hypothetical protein